jgi:non-specific serine/threonine protein kinase
MAIWTSEIKELEKLFKSLKGQLPDLDKELERLIRADDENMILLYSRRCLEVIITDLCECELKRPRKTEPLKGIIDKLHKEEKVPSHIITSMHGLNELSTYGAHPKDFDPEQVKPVLINLGIIIKWYLKYKDFAIEGKLKSTEGNPESKQPAVLPPEKSIIVLPFENMSSDPEQEYFSDGLTEEIITDLSHIHDLLVISRSSAMTFKGAKITIKEIAEKVNVRYVLEGSVRKSGNNLRITAQLIEASTDTHLWAEKYAGILDDVFDIQEKVSKSIANALKIKLSSDQKASMVKPKIGNAVAYDQYLIARNEIWRCSKESLSHAIQLLDNSLNSIGRHEYLLVALGTAYFQYVNAGIDPNPKHLDRAEELVDEAIELNPSLSKAHYIKSMIYETRGRLNESFDSIKRALELDPTDSEAMMMISFMYSMVGKPELAKPYAKPAILIDPLNPIIYWGEWWVNLSEGKLDHALETSYRAFNLDKVNMASIFGYAHTLAMNNKVKKATELFDSLIITYPTQFHTKLGKALRHAINNQNQDALQSLTEDLKKAAEMDHLIAWYLAEVYALIGENNKAIDFLERTTKDVFINYPLFAKHDPLLENIRGEERFKKLMEKIKYKWENFEV